MEQRADYLQRLAELDAVVARVRPAPEVIVERAAGLLAGRVGCRLGEAHAYLLQLASQHGREVSDVAAEIVSALDDQSAGVGVGRLRAVLDRALPVRRRPGRRQRILDPDAAGWARMMRQICDALPGQHAAMWPVRDEAGAVVDFEFVAVTPAVMDLSGRDGTQIRGKRLRELYPALVDGEIWQAWLAAVSDGEPREVGPVPYIGSTDRAPSDMTITVRTQPVGAGLLNTWIRHDEQTRMLERVVQTERLGSLGWSETDLVTGAVAWSEELYRIYERDPLFGPMSLQEQTALVLPDDQPIMRQALEMYERGDTVDVMYRVRVGDRVKYLRRVADTIRDGQGRPVKVYGIVQDVTAREISRVKLAEVEQQLREHQRSLAAEHQLAAQLQHIVLPIPAEPIDLPGLRVGIRYLPAEQASRVGGDWYHAASTDDGGVLLAIGDVAGHGLPAAAVMAQLRHALAALTITSTTDPALLLTHLNRLLFSAGTRATTATALVGRYDPATRTLVWAQAGHPPPLYTRDGATRQLPRPRGPLLGAIRDARYETETITLSPGDLLLLYTDGLVEDRERSLDEGLAPVIATLNRISRASSQQPLADLLSVLPQANPHDDTCILAARPLVTGDDRD